MIGLIVGLLLLALLLCVLAVAFYVAFVALRYIRFLYRNHWQPNGMGMFFALRGISHEQRYEIHHHHGGHHGS